MRNYIITVCVFIIVCAIVVLLIALTNSIRNPKELGNIVPEKPSDIQHSDKEKSESLIPPVKSCDVAEVGNYLSVDSILPIHLNEPKIYGEDISFTNKYTNNSPNEITLLFLEHKGILFTRFILYFGSDLDKRFDMYSSNITGYEDALTEFGIECIKYGKNIEIVLKPSESKEIRHDVSKIFDITEPGEYWSEVVYDYKLHDGTIERSSVGSNRKFTILE